MQVTRGSLRTLMILAVFAATPGCNQSDGGDGGRAVVDFAFSGRDVPLDTLHGTGAMADVRWLMGSSEVGAWAIGDKAGTLASWPLVVGERQLARTYRRAASGMAALNVQADGTIALQLYDASKPEDVPRVVPLAGLSSRAMSENEDQLSFAELCASRAPVWRTPDGVSAMDQWQLAANADESLWLVLLSTCGYVDAYVYDAAGERQHGTVLFEPPFDADVIRVFLPLSASLQPSRGMGLGTVMVVDDPSDYKKDPADAAKSFLVKVIGPTGEGSTVTFAAPADTTVFDFAVDDASGAPQRIVFVGTLSTPTPGIPNDREQEDAWLAIVDMQTGAATASHTFHHARDDYLRAATFTADGGVVAVGDTDRHHVDSGSWDGGSEVLVARYDAALAQQELLTFGDDRMDTAYGVLAASDGIVVAGRWNAMPNNHWAESENWFQGFAAFLPPNGWHQ